jgi:hypothetical protein
MKTEISISDLLKIVNPIKEEISYKNQQVQIDFKKLKEFVDQPKKNEVFNLNGDLTNDLHKNLALYIINSTDDSHIIHIDLNNEYIFEPGKGLFEYIKCIYNKNKTCYINLDEVGDNLLLIKSKKLEPLSNSGAINSAIDTHYASIGSLFSDMTKIDLNTLKNDKLTNQGQVTWQEDNYNNYANLDYVLEKIKNIAGSDAEYSRQSRYSTNSVDSFKDDFNKIIAMADAKVLNSDSFKLALIDMNKKSINSDLVNRFYAKEKTQRLFYIDFSEDIFQDKLMQLIKTDNFTLLEKLIAPYLSELSMYEQTTSYRGNSAKPTSNINFELLINQPETVKHLIDKYNSSYSRKDTDFDVVSVYGLLNETNKNNSEIIKKYLRLITDSNGRDSRSINRTKLFKLPPELFNEKEFLSNIIDAVDFEELKKFLKQNQIKPTVLADKEFILSNHGVNGYKLKSWIKNFLDKSMLTKDFFKELIANKPGFYNSLSENWPEFAKNMEIISIAIKGGTILKNISSHIMYDLLLEDHEKKYEDLKIRYFIENRDIIDIVSRFKHMGYSPEEVEKVKEKYEKVEYMFYKVDDWYSEYDHASKLLAKFKKAENILEILNNIDSNSFDYNFNANFFYNSLHKPLRKDKQIITRILEMGPISYSSLDENLAYNTDIVIKCLASSPEDLKKIPQEFFSSSNFAIKFAGLMDQHLFEEKDIPSFITKFFENQEVTSDYQNYLKMHLSYKEMQGDLDAPTQVKNKRIKL